MSEASSSDSEHEEIQMEAQSDRLVPAKNFRDDVSAAAGDSIKAFN
jgi:hypothetical protein